MIKKILFLFFFSGQILFSQVKLLKGKIVSESINLEGIHVINKTFGNATTSSSGGYFSLQVRLNDTVYFSAIHLEAKQLVVRENDLSKELLFVSMKYMVKQLDEITLIKYKNITPEALGIIPKGIRTYTPAERKLAAAGEFKWYSPLLIPLGGMSVDGLVNAISGRTAMLKKEYEVEKKEFFMEDVMLTFGKTFFQEQLKIPEDYIEGFLFYLAEDMEFRNFYKLHTKLMVEFELNKLAKQYLEKIKG